MRDVKWNQMFERLKGYKHEHGDCLVPQKYAKDKQLGIWVNEQRRNCEANTLTAKRKAKLYSIGFVWKPLNDQWNEMFEKLKTYKSMNGDCLVPTEYSRDKQLGIWVTSQRKFYKLNKLLAERKAKLESIGFIWKTGDDQWNHMFKKLKAYKFENGDCLVPQLYAKDKQLGIWVMNQRREHEANTLTAERKAKLDLIGFVWEPHVYQWNLMFEKLLAYKFEHGDCLVPRRYARDKQLGLWVMTQRIRNKNDTLTAEQKARLDSIGFIWRAKPEYKPESDEEWNHMYEKMIAFRQKHGHCLVLFGSDRKLGSWVIRQRAMRKVGQLSDDRRAKLDSIDGFVWTVDIPDDRWCIMFEKLKAYKSQHGDCLVPQLYAADKQLSRWVRTQRYNYKSNKLLAERKEKLESIGFVWDAREYKRQQKEQHQPNASSGV